jgi:hypothetical protein
MASNPLHEPIAALKFIVDFAQADFESISRHEYRMLERGISYFLYRDVSAGWTATAPQLKTMQLFQQGALEPLKNISRRQSVFLKDLTLSFWCYPDGAGARVQVVGDQHAKLLYQIVRVIESVGFEKVQACPECGRLFVKVTKKRFCSTRCQSRVYMRQYRKD